MITSFFLSSWFRASWFNVNKNPTDATVCRYLVTAKLLYMFRVSQHPSSGVLKTVPAASGTGHTTCTATPLQRGLIWTASRSDHVAYCCICWIFIHIINSLKVPKIKKILLYEMKFLVPNYSCLQSLWLGATAPRSSSSLPSTELVEPPPEQNSWERHCW